MRWIVAAAFLILGCEDYHECAPPSSAELSAFPLRLSETGLFDDVVSERLSPGVRAYEPRFAFWSDGAAKRRWVSLPPGAQIDSSDMDFWRFPEGTKLWKEFTRDGVRIETRLMHKVGPDDGDWSFSAYLWNGDGSDAVLRPFGVIDAHSTPHDVPAATECIGCHGGIAGRVLGFSAIQLGHDTPAEQVDLRNLIDEDALSDPLSDMPELPGDETTAAALGYLHANCGHCHNQARPPSNGPRCFDPDVDLDFWLRIDELGSAEATATYRTFGEIVERGAPDDSELIDRVSSRAFFVAMPPLGTDEVDPEGIVLLRTWISSL